MSVVERNGDSKLWITVLVALAAGLLVLMALGAAFFGVYVWPSISKELFPVQSTEHAGFFPYGFGVREEPLPAAVPPKATLAIAPFACQAEEEGYDWLGYAFAYGTVSRLANFNELVIAGPEDIREELANEQSELTLSGITSSAAAREAGGAVRADYVLIGNCAKWGDEIRVTARIVEVATGNIHSERAGIREYGKILDFHAELARWVVEALDITVDSARLERIKYKPTQSIPAYECFGQGVMHYYRGEYEQGIAACHKALDIDSDFADAHIVLARALGCQEKYEEAITQLKKVEKLDAERSYLHYYLGIAYRENEDYDEAVDELRQAVDKRPGDRRVWYELGLAYSERGASHYYDFYSYHDSDESYPAMADCRLATGAFSRVLELEPTLAEVYVRRAKAYYGMCDYEAAVQDCNRAIQINPELAGAYTTRGDAYDEVGEHDRALADYDQSLSLEPSAVAYHLRGLVYWRRDEYDQAIADYTQALELDPKCCMTWNNRASTYVDIGEYDLAISDATRGLELDPDHVKLIVNRAHAYFKKGDWHYAIPDLTRSIELDPINRCWSRWARAYAYYHTQKYQQSVADWSRYLEEYAETDGFADVVAAWANRGTAYRKLGKYEKALADVNHALDMDPDRGCAYAIRGLIYYETEDYEQAWADARTALEKAPQCSGGYSLQGDLYAHEGNYQKAIASYEQALEYEHPGEGTETFYGLATVHKKVGDYSTAREYLQKALEQLPEHKEAQELLNELDRLSE